MTDTSSMGEIPDDIMKTAMRIKAECNVDFGGGIGGGAIIRMIADGILGERERCAKAAEDWIKTFGDADPEFISAKAFAADAVLDIRDVIRKGVSP